MRSRLESVKPLDANVEKDGAKEIQYDKDSYDYLFDEDELLFEQDLQDLIDEDDKASYYEDSKNSQQEMSDMIAESEMSDEQLKELWSASNLGKYTMETPIQAKQAVQYQEKYMEPVSEIEFQEISDEVDCEDAEMQKKLEEMAQELEGFF